MTEYVVTLKNDGVILNDDDVDDVYRIIDSCLERQTSEISIDVFLWLLLLDFIPSFVLLCARSEMSRPNFLVVCSRYQSYTSIVLMIDHCR